MSENFSSKLRSGKRSKVDPEHGVVFGIVTQSGSSNGEWLVQGAKFRPDLS